MDGPNAVPHQSAPAATGRSATLLAAKSSKHTVAFAPPTPPATAELPKSETELDLEKRRQSKAFSILGAESEHAMVHLTRLELAWSQKEKFEKPPDVLERLNANIAHQMGRFAAGRLTLIVVGGLSKVGCKCMDRHRVKVLSFLAAVTVVGFALNIVAYYGLVTKTAATLPWGVRNEVRDEHQLAWLITTTQLDSAQPLYSSDLNETHPFVFNAITQAQLQLGYGSSFEERVELLNDFFFPLLPNIAPRQDSTLRLQDTGTLRMHASLLEQCYMAKGNASWMVPFLSPPFSPCVDLHSLKARFIDTIAHGKAVDSCTDAFGPVRNNLLIGGIILGTLGTLTEGTGALLAATSIHSGRFDKYSDWGLAKVLQCFLVFLLSLAIDLNALLIYTDLCFNNPAVYEVAPKAVLDVSRMTYAPNSTSPFFHEPPVPNEVGICYFCAICALCIKLLNPILQFVIPARDIRYARLTINKLPDVPRVEDGAFEDGLLEAVKRSGRYAARSRASTAKSGDASSSNETTLQRYTGEL